MFAQSRSSKITAENDWQQERKSDTRCVSTTITLNAEMMNRNFTVFSAKVKNTQILFFLFGL
jgi:hypothetical protein